MLPGWCCMFGAKERRQLIPHVRFQVPFLGPESQLKSGFACAGLLCRDRGKFTVVPSRSWGSTIVGVALAHLAGLLETVRLGLEGLYLPLGGPERLAVRVGQSIDCLGHARLCVELGSEWQVLH